MIEPVSAVSSAPVSIARADTTLPSGRAEAVGEPLPVPTAQEVVGFDAAARALRAEDVTASPVPRGKDTWSRMTRGVGGSMERLSKSEVRVNNSSGLYKQPPDVAVVDPGHSVGSAGQASGRPVAYSDLIGEMQAKLPEIVARGRDMMEFHITTSILTSTASEFRDSIKKLAEGNA